MADGKRWVALEKATRRGRYAAIPLGEVWMNDEYVVHCEDIKDGITELSIRRFDRGAARDWRDFQRIKNQLCGPEREGLELYPAESRLMDTANQYYVWVLPLGTVIPVGFPQRNVSTARQATMMGATQRPLDPGVEPTHTDQEMGEMVAELDRQVGPRREPPPDDGYYGTNLGIKR